MVGKHLFIIAALIAGILAGCALSDKTTSDIKESVSLLNTSNSSPSSTVVTDDFGFKVSVMPLPKRIVSLAPSNTEILFALGLGSRIVGVTDYCNYPPEALKKTKVGGFSTISIERVLDLDPDLVVAARGNGEETVKVLRNLGLRVVALDPQSMTDIMKDILLLGKLTGAEENASRLVNFMNCRIEKVKNAISNLNYRPRVAHILWTDPIWVSGNGTFIDDLIRRAGGMNVFSDLKGWRIVSVEDLVERNPDVIIVSSGGGMGGSGDLLYRWVMNNLKNVEAVKNSRVYLIDADIISRPSYRLVFALEQIATFLHPGVQFNTSECDFLYESLYIAENAHSENVSQ